MAQIAGVNHEIGSLGQSVDLVDRYLQGRSNIRICRLIETNVAIADLNEGEVPAHRFLLRAFGEHLRYGDSSAQGPNQARSRPRHTLQKTAAVNSVIVEIVRSLIDEILFLFCHLPSVLLLSELITGKASLLFHRFAK